jgi:hypothetical protein
MILGALIDAGVSLQELREELAKMDIGEYDVEIKEVIKRDIKGVKVDISIIDDRRFTPQEMCDIVNTSRLDEPIKETACKIIERLVKAEATVHGIPQSEVHFHELGDKDTIIDVVGTVICIHKLGIKKIYSSPLNVGYGRVECRHGTFPIPAPATAELIKDIPVYSSENNTNNVELTTPTGAAIITTMCYKFGNMPQMNIKHIGYGAGTFDTVNMPNLLRVFIGEQDNIYEEDRIVLLETNIDNMNPEIYPYLMDKSIKCGAIDVYLIPVYGKKGRPGMILNIMCSENDVDNLLSFVFSQTTTTGIRISRIQRRKLPRKIVKVNTRYGELEAKEIVFEDTKKIMPEYEVCKKVAEMNNIPLQDVYMEMYRNLNK